MFFHLFYKGNNFCDFLFTYPERFRLFKRWSTAKGKNLHPQEQTLFSSSGRTPGRAIVLLLAAASALAKC